MAERPKDTLTPEGRISYPYLFQPDDDGNRRVTLIFPATADLSGLKTLLREAATAKWGANIPKNLRNPLHSNADKAAAGTDGYQDAGGWHATFKTDRGTPPVIAQDGQTELTAQSGAFYAGCYGRVCCTAYAWQNDKGAGVSFNLVAAQKTRDGEPFSAASRYEPGMFTPVAETAGGGDIGDDLFE